MYNIIVWWDNTIVGYNNYAHTVIRLTPSYIISIVLTLKHSRFDTNENKLYI